ncbi:MAG TPA: dihydrofolate reductase [Gammaproteobacteria bacterium]|nr:dihydrofolate reductase [Gammaproteobacteria bacterium]
MIISLVAAMTPQRVIGKNNQLPWPTMPADMAHFKKITLGKPILMGRKTYQSIGRLLPGRKNIIITRDKNFNVDGAEIFYDVNTALKSVENYSEVCVIGGGEIYSAVLPQADILYLSYIYADISGDSFFPEFDEKLFKEISREDHKADENNPYDYSFVTLKRI